MEFRVKFKVVLRRGAAIDGRDLRRKVGGTLSSLSCLRLVFTLILILIFMRRPKPAGFTIAWWRWGNSKARKEKKRSRVKRPREAACWQKIYLPGGRRCSSYEGGD